MSEVTIPRSELSKIPYLNLEAAERRSGIPILPYWNGERWLIWIPTNGKLFEMHPVDACEASYVAKSAERESDLRIPFVEFMWQRGALSHVSGQFDALCDDFQNLFGSVAKLKHLHLTRRLGVMSIPQVFIRTELEYMLTVARGIFDLLYETIRRVWEKTLLSSTGAPPSKKLPKKFSKFALSGPDEKPRSAADMVMDFGVPGVFASAVERHLSFFCQLRSLRNAVVHGIGRAPTFFVLEGGFGVSPEERPFASFVWQPSHHFNEAVVSLLPWMAHLVVNTVEACNELIYSFANEVLFPPEIAPGYFVFVRCPTGEAVIDIMAAYRNELVWWPAPPYAS